MSEQPWPFFANTDLLDFPGARPRQPVDLVEYLAESEKDPLKELLLRGKVAYLFERYVAEQELTSMLLCVRPSNQDVVDLPEMIDKWVAVSHGSTPQSRVGKTIVLFLILTWFDTHFVEKGGDEKADPGERFKSRIYSSIESFFAKTHKWPEDWTPGEPFKNTYWLRNPEYPAESIIVYDEAKREVELRSDKTDYIQSLREGYLSVPSVEKYFREPARAFDEALKLNDGGVGYLANNLGPVCLPELRVEQTVSRIETLCGQVQHLLSQFHVSDDFETRLAERREITNHILQHIQRLGTEGRFANLLRALQISQHGFSGVLYDFYTRRSQDVADDEKADSAANTPPIRKPAFSGAPPLPNAPPLPGTPPLPGSSVTETQIEQPSEVEDSATKNSRSANPVSMNLARAAVEYWMNVVRTKSESDFLGGFFEGDTQLSLELVNELSSAARRLRLDQEVCAAIDRLSGTINEGIDVTIEKAAFASSTVVNRFVSRLHFDQRPESERPVYPTIDGTEGRIFGHPKAANGAAEIDLEPRNQQYDALAHWMYGFHQLVTDNAEAIDGSAVNREQNAALGEILKSIADAVSLTKDDPAS